MVLKRQPRAQEVGGVAVLSVPVEGAVPFWRAVVAGWVSSGSDGGWRGSKGGARCGLP